MGRGFIHFNYPLQLPTGAPPEAKSQSCQGLGSKSQTSDPRGPGRDGESIPDKPWGARPTPCPREAHPSPLSPPAFPCPARPVPPPGQRCHLPASAGSAGEPRFHHHHHPPPPAGPRQGERVAFKVRRKGAASAQPRLGVKTQHEHSPPKNGGMHRHTPPSSAPKQQGPEALGASPGCSVPPHPDAIWPPWHPPAKPPPPQHQSPWGEMQRLPHPGSPPFLHLPPQLYTAPTAEGHGAQWETQKGLLLTPKLPGSPCPQGQERRLSRGKTPLLATPTPELQCFVAPHLSI